jgi:hypothetical protein
MADDKQERIETLQDRVDELEATVSKMLPSRRDALKLGAAGALGAAGMAGSASAQTQTGTIGTSSNPVDLNAEDITTSSIDAATIDTDQILARTGAQLGGDLNAAGNNIDNVGSLNTDEIGNAGSSFSVVDRLSLNGNSLNDDQAEFRMRDLGTVADGGKVALDPDSLGKSNAIILIAAGNGDHALVATRGGNDNVSILAQVGSNWSTTEDNNGTTNVYFDSGNGRYELNDEGGGTIYTCLYFNINTTF